MTIRLKESSAKPSWKFYDQPADDNPEYRLAENLVMEFTDIVGMSCTYYINDTAVEADQLYGEKQDVEYEDGKDTKIIYELGEIPTIYTLFGVMAQDSIISYIPRSVFKRDVSSTQSPKVGDVVVVHNYDDDVSDNLEGRTFEIIHVAQDTSIFQYRSLVYVLNLIPYRYSEETVDAAEVSSDISTSAPHISAFGDNEWIDENKDVKDGTDTSIYGY